MKATVIASTHENYKATPKELFELGGRIGGICYLSKSYFDKSVADPEKSLKRAHNTAISGHHSVFDHGSITLLIEGIPKIMAMILNSLGINETSERSGRYTKLEPLTEKEGELYEKWRAKFNTIIPQVYPDMLPNPDDKKALASIDKLAQENARYMTSVFTPTTMAYTTVFKQWCYIVQWMEKLKESLTGLDKFSERLRHSIDDFINAVRPKVYYEEIVDHKNRCFDFMSVQTNSLFYDTNVELVDTFGYNYMVTYKGSFTHAAQAQRHRTLKFNIQFSGKSEEFYVPPILFESGDVDEWLTDIKSIADETPQGTLVNIIERGTVENFILKCTERLCGRAQLEITNQTVDTYKKMLASESLPEEVRKLLEESFTVNGEVVTRCGSKVYTCKEGCFFGAKSGLNRLI